MTWTIFETEILLAHTLGLKRIELHTNHKKVLSQAELSRFKSLIKRRSKHEPIAYITNRQPFMSLDFYVDRSVLIPRPETEELVELTIDLIKSSPVTRHPLLVADIGTGCGAIAISLAKYLPDIKVIGIDSSPDAIKIAQRNAEHHKVDNRCQFIIGNMLEPLKEKFDIIVSNPPYIPSDDIDHLEPDVKDWEPRKALDGGKDGLSCIRKLIQESPKYLKKEGFLVFEFGINQAEKIKELTKGVFQEIKIIKDASGKERFFLGRK